MNLATLDIGETKHAVEISAELPDAAESGVGVTLQGRSFAPGAAKNNATVDNDVPHVKVGKPEEPVAKQVIAPIAKASLARRSKRPAPKRR